MPRRDRFEDDDFDDRPRRSRRDDDPPRRSRDNVYVSEKKPGLATAAAILWLIWAGFLVVSVMYRALLLLRIVADDGDGNPLCGAVDVVLILAMAVLTGGAGIMTLLGKARSLKSFGIFSLVMPPAIVFMETALGFFAGMEATRHGPRGSDLPLIMAFRGFIFTTLLVSGVMLAGIFALSVNKKYRAWSSRQGNK